jgi:murein DD-endopeptidase MepM/ murein hydrolase activator NlpD
MKRLVSFVIGCIALPLAAIAGITGSGDSDPACNHQTAPSGPDRRPAATGQWNTEQIANAATIVEVGHTNQVPPWGWVIAVATAIQESQLRNLPHLGEDNDHDSIGLFQQRPSQGWGTAEQLSDPAYQAGKFYDALLDVAQWQEMTLTQAAQAVQKSAHPDAYAQHTTDAVQLVSEVGITLGPSTAVMAGCVTISPAGWTQPLHGPVVSGYGIRAGRMHHGTDIAAPRHTIIRAAASGTVTRVACNAIDRHTGQDWGCHRDGDPNRTAGCGWYAELTHPGAVTTRYCHMQTRPWVDAGDAVIAGQPIGTVGSTGHSSGPHLHYEVRVDGRSVDPQPWMDDHRAPVGMG